MASASTTAVDARPALSELGRLGWLKWVPVLGSAAFYVDFIARSRVRLAGSTAYVLADDAMISMVYARHLAEGDGLVWGDGHRVEGYSNFLWTLWMAFLHVFGGSELRVSLLVMISSAAVLVLTMVVAGRICAELAPGRPAVEAVAMLLTGLYYPLAFWALRGLETGLVALWMALMALLALRLSKRFERRWAWALAATMSAALLTRDEMLIPCALTWAFLVWAGPRESRRAMTVYLGGAVLLTLAGHEIYRLAYYGQALPNTYYLKLSGVPLATRLHRGVESVAHTWIVTLYAPLLMAGAYFLARGRSIARGPVLLAALFVGASAYSVYVGGDISEDLLYANRYVAAAAPTLMVLAALGIGELVDRAGNRRLRLAVAGAFIAAAALVAFNWLPTGALGSNPFYSETGIEIARAAVAVAIALGVLATPMLARITAARRVTGPVLAVMALGLLVLFQVDRQPGQEWVRYNALGNLSDAYYANYGLIIRQHTSPGTAVASAAVGNLAYFSHRRVVDLLGKVDPVIARGKNQTVGLFKPGHSKWNYAYSIGQLRPAVVAELFRPTPRDLCNLAGWGYRQIAPDFYTHTGAPGIDTKGLARAITRTDFKPPDPQPHNCPGPPA
jgi:hypothetical protein